MNRLAKLIERLDKDDLLLLQKDLDSGNIERIISRRMQKYDTQKPCPICGSAVPENAGYRLEFGPWDLRQRAHFDAPDCLQFFINSNLSTKDNA